MAIKLDKETITRLSNFVIYKVFYEHVDNSNGKNLYLILTHLLLTKLGDVPNFPIADDCTVRIYIQSLGDHLQIHMLTQRRAIFIHYVKLIIYGLIPIIQISRIISHFIKVLFSKMYWPFKNFSAVLYRLWRYFQDAIAKMPRIGQGDDS